MYICVLLDRAFRYAYSLEGVYPSLEGITIVGGRVLIGGSKLAAVFRAFCIRSASRTTRAAMASTIGTARGTTQGSWRPLAASVPGVPSYWAVF